MAGLKPTRYLKSVTELDPLHDIYEAGYRFVLLDMDNTLRPRDTHVIPEDVRAWIKELISLGITPCVLSNSFHESTRRDAEELGMKVVMKAMKPLPFAYSKVLTLLGASKKQTLCIGDQLSTDIWGANAAGMTSVLVCPQCDVDPVHTAKLRKIEYLLMGRMKPE